MSIPTIDDFYKNNDVAEEFDADFYAEQHLNIKDFYQPHCRDNFISEEKRLYYHWFFYGKMIGYTPCSNINIKKGYDPDIINEDISVVVSCKDRSEMLEISVRSWILKHQIKEIIIVDWCSSQSLKRFENIDNRIKVIRIENQPFYNASKPINIAIQQAKYEKILKMDVDYILNPYLPLESLVDIQEGEFVAGNWQQYHLDNSLGFIRNLNGIICCHRKFFLKAGLYNEDIDNYGREDCEMFERLQSIGVKRKDIEFSPNHVPVYHNPHGDNLRSMNRKDTNVNETLSYFIKKYGCTNFELVINLYKDKLESRTKELIDCLKINLENKHIDRIHVFLENYNDFPEFYELKKLYEDKITAMNTDTRMSFKSIFDYTNKNIINKQCIVANNDIAFGSDLSKIKGMKPRDFISLTRHEGDTLAQNRSRDAICSQDAWIFRSPMVDDLEELDDDIIIGTYYSDVVLSYCIYMSKQYSAWNLCNDIVIQHFHKTTDHDHDTKSRSETQQKQSYYCQRFNNEHFNRNLVPTDIEDYYKSKNANKFITNHEYDLNNY